MADKQIFDFVLKNKKYIKAVTVSTKRLSPRLNIELKKHDVPVFVHTVNNLEHMYKLMSKYVFGFYTDATNELTNVLYPSK